MKSIFYQIMLLCTSQYFMSCTDIKDKNTSRKNDTEFPPPPKKGQTE